MPGRFGVEDVNLPLALLYIAKPLLENGYEPEIFDARLVNHKNITRNYLNQFLCVGITMMAGEQVKLALDAAKHIKRLKPELMIVVGGPQCSSIPIQVVRNPYFDIAVKGEGEEAMLEICNAVVNRSGLKKVKGITFIGKDREITQTGERPIRDINTSAGLPYSLLDIKRYPNIYDKFEYISSKGCPHRCGFCSNEINYKSRWIPKKPEVVIAELDEIITKFNPRRIVFNDANVFVNQKRMEEIAKAIIKKRWKTEFYAQIRADYLARYPDDFLQLLKKANFRELAFGAESGSQKMLDFVQKDITVEQIITAVKKLKRNGMKAIISLMMGFPTETSRDLKKTLRIYDKIKKIDKNAMINGMFIYSPYPDCKLTEFIRQKYNYKLPSTLDQWAYKWRFNDKKHLRWVSKRQQAKYESISICVRIMFINQLLRSWDMKQKKARFKSMPNLFLILLFNKIYDVIAKLRWKTRFFYVPYELRFWHFMYSRTKGMT